MDVKNNIWKVYIPSHALNSETGYIHGKIVKQRKMACIECISSKIQCKGSVIGIWRNSKTCHGSSVGALGADPWIELSLSNSGALSCNLKNPQCKDQNIKSQCILYDPCDLLSSYILTNNSVLHPKNLHMNNKITVSHGHVFTVVSCLLEFAERSKVSQSKLEEKKRTVVSHGLFYPICNLLLHPFILLFLLFGKLLDNSYTRNSYAEACLDAPALTRHIRCRAAFLRNIFTQRNESPMRRLSYLDTCARQIVDSMLGVCVLVVMVNATLADTAAAGIMSWADSVATSLTQRINWMMGAPAGLKLNSQLTHFLGHFFLYHIYLWTGYLSLLRPALGILLQCSSVLGVIGVSAQLCLIQDIISMMTVHIYCFYVYAARLYSLQVYSLASLWRLFRGKKWNVLRHRVDSAVYDIDQLIVGTLFFTILLFLLPTTLLYYVFFLALRLIVLVSEGVLVFCVRVVNHLPVYSLIMWLFGSNTVAGDVLFTVVPESFTGDSLVLTMQPTQLPLSGLLKEVDTSPGPPSPSDSLGTLLHKILKGHLIYPWIDDVNPSDKKKMA